MPPRRADYSEVNSIMVGNFSREPKVLR